MTRFNVISATLGAVRPLALGIALLSASVCRGPSVCWGQGIGSPTVPSNPTSGLYRTGFDVIRANTINRPTVSPYLNLIQPGGGLSTNYQTLVRPAMEQQRINRDQELQMNRLQQQFNAALQSSAARPQQGRGIRPTGHQAAFFFFSNFYPNLRPTR